VTLKHAFRLIDRAPERSIWFVAETDADVASAHRLAKDTGNRHGRLAFYISGPKAPAPLMMQSPPHPVKTCVETVTIAAELPIRGSPREAIKVQHRACGSGPGSTRSNSTEKNISVYLTIIYSTFFYQILATKQCILGLKLSPNGSTSRLHPWMHCRRSLTAQRPSSA